MRDAILVINVERSPVARYGLLPALWQSEAPRYGRHLELAAKRAHGDFALSDAILSILAAALTFTRRPPFSSRHCAQQRMLRKQNVADRHGMPTHHATTTPHTASIHTGISSEDSTRA